MKFTIEELLLNEEFKDKINKPEKKLQSFQKNNKLHHSVIKTMKADLSQYYEDVEYFMGSRVRKPYWTVGHRKPFKKKVTMQGKYKRIKDTDIEMKLFKNWIASNDSGRKYSFRSIIEEMGILVILNQNRINKLIKYVQDNQNEFVTIQSIQNDEQRNEMIREIVLDFEYSISRKVKRLAEQLVKYCDIPYTLGYVKLIKTKVMDEVTNKKKEIVTFEETNKQIYYRFEQEIKTIKGEHRFDIINKREKLCKELFGCSHIFEVYGYNDREVHIKSLPLSEEFNIRDEIRLSIKENILKNAKNREQLKNKKEYIKTYDEILHETDLDVITVLGDELWLKHPVTELDNSITRFKRNREYLKIYTVLFEKLITLDKAPTSTHKDKFKCLIKLEMDKKEALEA